MPFCAFTGGWRRYAKRREVLRPYAGGPGIPPTDVLVTLLGQCNRHSFGNVLKCWLVMVLGVPWLKYFINANPLVYDLEERFVQQIATSLADCGPENA